MKDLGFSAEREGYSFFQVASVVILVYLAISCTAQEQSSSNKVPQDGSAGQAGKSVPALEQPSIEQQIDQYVTDYLLGGIVIDKMYEVDKLKADFGRYENISQEPAKIDYEGMKGDHLNKYRYRDFDLVFYVVENDREIFAYLEILEGIATPIGVVGDSMESVEARFSGKLKKWSDTLYSIGLSGRNYLSGLTLEAKNGFLTKIMIDLGEI